MRPWNLYENKFVDIKVRRIEEGDAAGGLPS
jgi:hypothetical protein